MPDLPSDPEQLARQILTGKLSIQDLAREQARRRAGGATVTRPQGQSPASSSQRPPSTIHPAPRPPAQIPVQIVQPVNQAPAQSMRQSAGLPPSALRPTMNPGTNPRPTAPSRPVAAPVQPSPHTSQPGTQPRRPTAGSQGPKAKMAAPIVAEGAAGPSGVAGAQSRSDVSPGQRLATALSNPQQLSNAILLAEIIGKPLALRPEAERAW